MTKKSVSIGTILQRQVEDGSIQVMHISKELYHQIGEGNFHPQCSRGEAPEEIIILSDSATAFAVCAEHWTHIVSC